MEPSGGILIIRKEKLSVSILNSELVLKKPVFVISFVILHSRSKVAASTFVNAIRINYGKKNYFLNFAYINFLTDIKIIKFY